jgi:hypothetical protein
MTISRPRYLLASFAIMIVGAACADDVAAPEALELAESAPMFRVIPTYAPDMKSADLVVEPSGGTFILGRHAIRFPANSICDPAVSSYGVTEWDKPCTPIASPIEIRAELREVDGRSWVDFTPALRFVPSNDGDQWVYLFMWTRATTRGKGSDAPTILWSPAIGVPGIDESLTDPTLETKWNGRLGGVYRRIKHFSGYNVHSGYKIAEF